MELSVCIITKNECTRLERCLTALLPLEAELVVVDTGSSDGTVSMAGRYANALYSFPWVEDFAAAKNFAISCAKNDYVLVVDSDEYLQEYNAEALLHSFLSHPGEAGRISRRNQLTRDGERNEYTDHTNRLFDRRRFHFQGRIHEQLVRGSVFTAGKDAAEASPYETYDTGLCFLHDGYEGSPEERRKKAERNRKLLLEELEQSPEDTYLLYQLGKSCYMAGDFTEAVYYFDQAAAYEMNPKLEYVIDLVETYGYALLNSGQEERAMQFTGLYEDFKDSADFLFLMGLIYMNNGQSAEAVGEFLKAASRPSAKASGVNSYRAYYNAGVIYETLGELKQARRMYRLCGEYERAKKRLEIIS